MRETMAAAPPSFLSTAAFSPLPPLPVSRSPRTDMTATPSFAISSFGLASSVLSTMRNDLR